jgi:3-oxo-5alpha-steroid 4-dehydrogenase
VIIGFGGAAAAAGLQAREEGASVIAVERFDGGGATAFSGGIIYAGGTRFQKDAGFDDNAEEMYKYLTAEGMAVSDATIRRFCQTSNANLEWVAGYGVQYSSSYYAARTSYPPDGYYLYYSGMEKFHADAAKPAPRGHRPIGKGPGGRHYWAALRKAALDHGVQLLAHAPVRRLVQTRDGRVIGVEALKIPPEAWPRHRAFYKRVDPYSPFGGEKAEKAIADCREFEMSLPQERVLIRAAKGVVIAAGNYTYNLALMRRYVPGFAAAYRTLVRAGSMGCDGSGFELGVSVGGVGADMESAIIVRSTTPPYAFVRGVLVNKDGKRIIAEDSYLGNIGQTIANQSGTIAWLVVDRSMFWNGIRELLPPKELFSMFGGPAMLNILFGGTRKAGTLHKLAKKCGIDEQGLQRTVESYNAGAARAADPMGKLRDHLAPLHRAPFYAVNMSLTNRFGFAGGMGAGGLKVDEESGAVLREDGSAVPGLFAAGRSALGLPPIGHSSPRTTFSGLSIADTVFSGRRAAISITHEQPAVGARPMAGSRRVADAG